MIWLLQGTLVVCDASWKERPLKLLFTFRFGIILLGRSKLEITGPFL